MPQGAWSTPDSSDEVDTLKLVMGFALSGMDVRAVIRQELAMDIKRMFTMVLLHLQ